MFRDGIVQLRLAVSELFHHALNETFAETSAFVYGHDISRWQKDLFSHNVHIKWFTRRIEKGLEGEGVSQVVMILTICQHDAPDQDMIPDEALTPEYVYLDHASERRERIYRKQSCCFISGKRLCRRSPNSAMKI